MAAFNITGLQNFGYGNLTDGLEDSMDPRFQPKQYFSTNLEQIRTEVLPYFASLNAYPDPKLIEEKTDQYWSTYGSSSTITSKISSAKMSSPTSAPQRSSIPVRSE
jgi:hypothetical protein